MSPTSVPMPAIHELLAVLPAMILAVWGLLVLIVDFSILRSSSSQRRQRFLGILTLCGVLIALASCVVPILHRASPDTFPGIFTPSGASATRARSGC